MDGLSVVGATAGGSVSEFLFELLVWMEMVSLNVAASSCPSYGVAMDGAVLVLLSLFISMFDGMR